MIQEQYVSFETANLLKEKDFPQNPYMCNTAYTPKGKLSNNAKSFVHNYELFEASGIKPLSYSMAPTQAMAMRWLREVQNLHIWVEPNTSNENMFDAHVAKKYCYRVWAGVGYPTYEEACEEAIKYCLENLI
jgi:hypothetical protein